MFGSLQHLTPPTNLDNTALLTYALLAIFLILVLARLLGSLVTRVGQPRVVGEILAGILLGPTLLGNNLSQTITPMEVRPILNAIATIGLILFMFLAGIELDVSKVRSQLRRAIPLACLSVVIPAALGFPVAQAMHNSTYTGSTDTAFLPFALFIGAALSVTAFPIMAHILMERGELNSILGGLSVATAGIMSVVMFSYIAFAGAVAAANGFGGLLLRLIFIILFGLVAWFFVRPLFGRVLLGMVTSEGNVSGNGMAFIFGGMVLYGLISHLIGINALVGGFLWGISLPPSYLVRKVVANKVKDVALIFFLPIFFALSGFSTDFKLLTIETVPVIILILLAAISGKFLGAAPARMFGLTWNEVGVLGALFNTRGLLVLVVGLIGLQYNISNSLTFTILVIVALVTNLMTVPLLNLFSRVPLPAVISEER